MRERNVAVFRKDLLPISETFIKNQVSAYRKWTARLIGFSEIRGLSLHGLSPIILYPGSGWRERIALKRDQFLPLFGRGGLRIRRQLIALRPDLIHAHFGYDGILIAEAAMALNIPVLITLHGTDILTDWEAWRSGKDGFFFRFYPTRLQKLFKNPMVRFVAVSKALESKAIEKGVPRDRIRVVYTGIDTSQFVAQSNVKRGPASVLFVGRLVEFKGCEFLLRAMVTVHKQIQDVNLLVAGEGPLRSYLEKLAESLAINVTFLGRIEPVTVRKLLSEVRVLCLPSITDRDGAFEGFGMVMLEAQAAGVPVVTSAPAGIEAIIPGETGVLFGAGDIDALASGLIHFLSQSKERGTKTSATSREYTRDKFDIVACTERLEAYYDDILNMEE